MCERERKYGSKNSLVKMQAIEEVMDMYMRFCTGGEQIERGEKHFQSLSD